MQRAVVPAGLALARAAAPRAGAAAAAAARRGASAAAAASTTNSAAAAAGAGARRGLASAAAAAGEAGQGGKGNEQMMAAAAAAAGVAVLLVVGASKPQPGLVKKHEEEVGKLQGELAAKHEELSKLKGEVLRKGDEVAQRDQRIAALEEEKRQVESSAVTALSHLLELEQRLEQALAVGAEKLGEQIGQQLLADLAKSGDAEAADMEPAMTEAEPLMAAAAEAAAAEKQAADKAGRTASLPPTERQRALIFIKPHAGTVAVEALIEEKLKALGVDVVADARLSGPEIDKGELVDKHYYAIASKAVLLDPKDLTVSDKGRAAFEKAFSEKWEDVLAKGKVLNAKQACEKLGVDGDQLEALWRQVEKKNLVKFGGGFYVAQLQPDLFVLNGFYMQMRDKYCVPAARVHVYEIEWPKSQLSWKDFREKVLGSTDPAKAEPGSLRRAIYDNWASLGLPAKPDTGDNGVHGSASPFEALAEVNNWLGRDIPSDFYGAAVLAQGIDLDLLRKWLPDAQVPVDGKPQSIFDFVEDTDADECLARLAKVKEEVKAAEAPSA